jgi:hypothetical protein
MHAEPFDGLRRRTLAAGLTGWSLPQAPRQAARPAPALLLLLLAAALPGAAAAHELRPAIATLAVAPDGAVALDLTLNLEAVLAGIGPDHADTADSPGAPAYDRLRALDPEALDEAFAGFEDRFLDGLSLSTPDGTPVPLSVAALEVPEAPDPALARHSEVTLAGRLPEGAEALVWRYDPAFGHSVIRLWEGEEVTASEYVTASNASQPLALEGARRSAWEVAANYLQVGYVHVLPLGLDHILFVLGLFLLSPRLGPLLWQVSAFTLAHTIALALGATGTVLLPSRPVETLIAASIVYVALENLFTARLHPWRPALVFAFGLLHGLGFAGVLTEIGLPRENVVPALVAFNIGVELAQVTVIMAAFLLVGWAMRQDWYRRAIAIPFSVAIAVTASAWVLERSGLLA